MFIHAKKSKQLLLIAFMVITPLLQSCSSQYTASLLTFPQTTPEQFAIASAHPLATEAGSKVLQSGGNAFDAAVAIAAALGVVEPYGSGIGGGGFWLLYEAKSDRYVMIDGREKAPLKATKDLFIEDGNVDRDRATLSVLSAGIPGQIAAFEHITEHYGTKQLSELLIPAIQFAKEGFPVTPTYQRVISRRLKTLQKHPQSSAIFLDDGEIPPIDKLIIQPDLAQTLQIIADKGGRAFYEGELATRLVAAVNDLDGIWQTEDLARYQVIERKPIISYFREHKIISAAPPSSGGVALASMFNMLEPMNLTTLSEGARTHLLIETMRRAYYDRATFLGDPDFHKVPIHPLISDQHAEHHMKSYSSEMATESASLGPISIQTPQGTNTTHFSVLDQYGNIASVTMSINFSFGSGIIAGDTGILLNNEMDDFSSKPSSPNAYGLVGAEANAIAPEKRPLSSMSPTILRSPKQTAILGTPGGSRIITMVYLASLEALEGEPPEKWVSLPRFHHQYLPDQIQYEPDAFSEETLKYLKKRGHSTKALSYDYGNMQAILWNKETGSIEAASDPRGMGSAIVKKP